MTFILSHDGTSFIADSTNGFATDTRCCPPWCRTDADGNMPPCVWVILGYDNLVYGPNYLRLTWNGSSYEGYAEFSYDTVLQGITYRYVTSSLTCTDGIWTLEISDEVDGAILDQMGSATWTVAAHGEDGLPGTADEWGHRTEYICGAWTWPNWEVCEACTDNTMVWEWDNGWVQVPGTGTLCTVSCTIDFTACDAYQEG